MPFTISANSLRIETYFAVINWNFLTFKNITRKFFIYIPMNFWYSWNTGIVVLEIHFVNFSEMWAFCKCPLSPICLYFLEKTYLYRSFKNNTYLSNFSSLFERNTNWIDYCPISRVSKLFFIEIIVCHHLLQFCLQIQCNLPSLHCP